MPKYLINSILNNIQEFINKLKTIHKNRKILSY